MLSVHWTPVSNTKNILKNGIKKSKKGGVFCFPLTGHKSLDRWWLYFFNQCKVRDKKDYNGIVFHISQEDLPAYFGDWIVTNNSSNFEKEIKSLKELGQSFRDTILFRLGSEISLNEGLERTIPYNSDSSSFYLKLAKKAMEQDPKLYFEKYKSIDFMTFTFEHYQLVLSNHIPAKRILKVIPQGNEFGKILKKGKNIKILTKTSFEE